MIRAISPRKGSCALWATLLFLLGSAAGLSCATRPGETTTFASPSAPIMRTTPSPTAVPNVARWQTSSPTSTATPRIRIDTLPTGQYIVYSIDSGLLESSGVPITSLLVASSDGRTMGELFSAPGAFWRLSPDQRRIAFVRWSRLGQGGYTRQLEIFDSTTQSTVSLGATFLGSPASWSPDGGSLLLSSGSKIMLLRVPAEMAQELIDCRDIQADPSAECHHIAWSPGGRWISFYLGFGVAGADPRSGVYFMDAECVTLPSACLGSIRGPYSLGEEYAWSPDGDLIAFVPNEPPSASSLAAFEVELPDRRDVQSRIIWQGSGLVGPISWSPDSDMIATSMGLVIGFPSGQEIAVLADPRLEEVLFWIKSPLPSTSY